MQQWYDTYFNDFHEHLVLGISDREFTYYKVL
jgi:hypothetical protein